jgi:fibronectin type 3 domain-containing protein
VKAEDDSGLFSEPSSPVLQKAPGEIAEQIVLKKQSVPREIILTWTIKSPQKTERILIYKADGNDPLRLYKHSTENSFTDSDISPEKTYKYRIKAIYDDGSSSELSNEVIAKM